jgi:hypothetical protein
MKGEPRILKQRIEPLPLRGRRIETREGVRCEQQEGIETEPDRRLRGERRDQRATLKPPLEKRHTAPRERENRHPQEHRPFVISPGSGKLVEQRLGRMVIGRDERDGKVDCHEQVDEQHEGNQREHGLHHCHRPHRGHQLLALLPQADAAEEQLQRRQRCRQPQCGKARFGDHCSRLSVLCMPLATCGGM